jgi:uncharacterized surface protein with fasciclin (FAS1) repeats
VLCDSIRKAGMFDALKYGTSWTVFVPPDDAFALLSDRLASLTEQGLADLLLFHAIDGVVTFDELKCDEWIHMANGEPR